MPTKSESIYLAVLKTLKNNRVMVQTREDGVYIRLAGNQNNGEAFTLEWGKVYSFEEKINTDYVDTLPRRK